MKRALIYCALGIVLAVAGFFTGAVAQRDYDREQFVDEWRALAAECKDGCLVKGKPSGTIATVTLAEFASAGGTIGCTRPLRSF